MGGIHIGQDDNRQASPDIVVSGQSVMVEGTPRSAPEEPLLASLDSDGTISSITTAMARSLGVEASEVLGRRFADCLLPEDWERMERPFKQVMENRAQTEVRTVHPSSPTAGLVEMDLRLTPLEGSSASVLVLGASSQRDTTSLPSTASEVAEQILSWKELVIVATDREGRIVTFSPSAERCTGRSAHDVLGKEIKEVMDPDPSFLSSFSSALDKVFAGEMFVGEARFLGQDKSVLQLRWFMQPIKDMDGQVVGAMGFGHALPSYPGKDIAPAGIGINLEVLAETSTAFVESEDLAETIDKDLERLIDSMGVDFAVFRLVGVESKPRMVCAGMDFRRGRKLLESHLVGEGPLYRGVQNGASFISMDAKTDPRVVLEDQEVKSLICLPIRFGGETYGCAAFGSTKATTNFQAKLPILQLFCNQVAISMRRAKLKEELTLKNKELESLFETSMAVSGTLDLPRVLSTILSQASELVKADAVYLFQLDKNTTTLNLISAISPYNQELNGFALRIGEGITGLVAQTREGMLIERADKDTRSVLVPGTPDEPSSLISVPLKMGEELLGVVTLERVPGVPFNEADFRLIQLFSFQAATALNNALMFKRLKEHASSQQMYNILLTHDVANYNVPIHGYLEMLVKDPKLDERQRRFIKSSLAQSENITSLISDVRKLSLLRTMEAVKSFEPIDLTKVIKEVIESLSQNILYEDAEVHLFPPGKEVMVMGDSFVKDVVYNLISNACKHAGDAPIFVNLSEHKEGEAMFWRMDVKDMGGGVPIDRKEFLFRRFENVDADSASEGHGIGLSVVSALCERFGGKVWVEDSESTDKKKGSIFSVTFPMVKL